MSSMILASFFVGACAEVPYSKCHIARDNLIQDVQIIPDLSFSFLDQTFIKLFYKINIG